MPPKQVGQQLHVWDEDALKAFDKQLRPLIPLRSIIWNNDALGVFSEDFRLFLRSREEFLAAEITEAPYRAVVERYVGLAQNQLTRPQLLMLRSLPVGAIDGAIGEILRPLLAAFAAMYVFARHHRKATQRSLVEWEALFEGSLEELKGMKEAQLKLFVSPFDRLLTPAVAAVVETVVNTKSVIAQTTVGQYKDQSAELGVSEQGRKRGRSGCYICGADAHFARDCPRKPTTGTGSFPAKTSKPPLKVKIERQ